MKTNLFSKRFKTHVYDDNIKDFLLYGKIFIILYLNNQQLTPSYLFMSTQSRLLPFVEHYFRRSTSHSLLPMAKRYL